MLNQAIFNLIILTFAKVKQKYAIGSFILGLVVFLAILIQSVHSIHHLEEAFQRKQCYHDYSGQKQQFTHTHDFESCFSCEFTFSSSVKLFSKSYYYLNTEISKEQVFSFYNENPYCFSGSKTTLRGPPAL